MYAQVPVEFKLVGVIVRFWTQNPDFI